MTENNRELAERLASDPRFVRASPELFAPDPRDQEDAASKPLVPPPPGLRTGGNDQMREAALEGLSAAYGVDPTRARQFVEAGSGRAGGTVPAHDRLRESVTEGLIAEFGAEKGLISEHIYKSGKHVRMGDVCQDSKGTIYAVRRFDERSVVLESVQVGEMQVGTKFMSTCLLVRRSK